MEFEVQQTPSFGRWTKCTDQNTHVPLVWHVYKLYKHLGRCITTNYRTSIAILAPFVTYNQRSPCGTTQTLDATYTPGADPDTTKGPFLTPDTNIFGVRKHIIKRFSRCRHVHRFATREVYISFIVFTDAIEVYNGETM